MKRILVGAAAFGCIKGPSGAGKTEISVYWYHPHHHLSNNRVFRGPYGIIIITDTNEAALVASGVIPGAADTKQLVLSDITVCKASGSNDPATYVDPTTIPLLADRAEWLSGATSQTGPPPVTLCEIPPAGTATNLVRSAERTPLRWFN